MKTCLGCKYAQWYRTTNGRLHPGGDGRCVAPLPSMRLPEAFYWTSKPSPCGGHISRKRVLDDDCAFFQRADAPGGAK